MIFKVTIYTKKGKPQEKDFVFNGSDAQARSALKQVSQSLDKLVARGAIRSFTLGYTSIDEE